MSRSLKYLAVVLVFSGLLAAGLVLAVRRTPLLSAPATQEARPDAGPPVIRLDPSVAYQTITGWPANADAGHLDSPHFARYATELFDRAVNDLGITGVRLEVRSGAENRTDWFARLRSGEIARSEWRCRRYATVNDNDDPLQIDPAGFHFTELDRAVADVVLPLEARVEARGEPFSVTLTYVAFADQMTEAGCPADLRYLHGDVDEYVEFMVAATRHLADQHGVTPDAWELVLEPDNTRIWTPDRLGRAMAALGPRLAAAGFAPRFVAPSTASMQNAVRYVDGLASIPGATRHLFELSYHRYSGVSADALAAIVARAARLGATPAMLEHIGAPYETLHEDLKAGRNSSWMVLGLAFPKADDDGGDYFVVGPEGGVRLSENARVLRAYFRYIRPGAVRIEAVTTDDRFDPVAFVNRNGGRVVVVKAAAGGRFAVEGLPAGTYGVLFTNPSGTQTPFPDATPSPALTVEVPMAGVVSIFARP